MKQNLSIFGVVIVFIAILAITGMAEVNRYAIMSAEELINFPRAVPDEENAGTKLYAVLLRETDRVLIMRPLTKGEYGSFQVQAISYQIIEQEMLAAAIVMPVVTLSDVASLSSELVTFLQRQVNAISGFDVFTVPPLDAP